MKSEKKKIPNWLNNTMVVCVLVLSMGLIANSLEWRTKDKIYRFD